MMSKANWKRLEESHEMLPVDQEASTAPHSDQDLSSSSDSYHSWNFKDDELSMNLLEAIKNGMTADVKRLLDHGVDPNATYSLSQVTACHLAALKDDYSLSLLIKAGAFVLRTDRRGRTPLHLAAWAGHPEQITLLLRHIPKELQQEESIPLDTESELSKEINKKCEIEDKPDLPEQWVNSSNSNSRLEMLPVIQSGWTALHSACSRAQFACVQLLLDAGADPSLQDLSGRTPLDVVGEAYYSKYEIDVHNFRKTIMEFIIKNGKVNNTLNKVNTSLHVAVELQSKESIQDLLNIGATATCLNSNGFTAMHICVAKRLIEHLQLLVKFQYRDGKSMIDVQDNNGFTILHAAVRARWIEGVHLALKAGADLSIKAVDGEAPIHSAATIGDLRIFQVLLPFAINCIDYQNGKGHTALFVAIIHNHLEIVKLLILIENGASLKVKDLPYYHINVLHIAAEYGRIDILNLFDNYRHSVIKSLINDKCTRNFYSPIIYAVTNNHPACVEWLLQNGAKVDKVVQLRDDYNESNNKRTTALHIAAIKNHIDIIRIILKYNKKTIDIAIDEVLPLHEACIHGNKEIITLLIKNGADLSTECGKLKQPIELIMSHVSKPIDYIEELLNSCIRSHGNLRDINYKVRVDYNILWPNSSNVKKMNVIQALIDMTEKHEEEKLLQHPVVESFVYIQWQVLLVLLWPILGLYGLFILSVNIYIVSVFSDHDQNKQNMADYKIITNETIFDDDNFYPTYVYVCRYMTVVTVSLIFIQESIILYFKTTKYFQMKENWVKMIIMPWSFLLTALLSLRNSETVKDSPIEMEWLRIIACITVLLTWLQIMLLLSRFSRWGIYALMFEKVTIKVLKVLFVCGFLIIGFSLCFMIQFRTKPPFGGLWATITKTIVMMTSEYDYTSMIENALSIDASIIILQIIFLIFVIIASVVLMNLMVGVALDDISNLTKTGSQKRLQKQMDYFIPLQGILSFKFIRNILSKKYLMKLLMSERKYIELEPNSLTCADNNLLPDDIKEAIFEKVQLRMKKMNFDQDPLHNKNKIDDIYSAIVNLRKTIDILENNVSSK